MTETIQFLKQALTSVEMDLEQTSRYLEVDFASLRQAGEKLTKLCVRRSELQRAIRTLEDAS